MCNVITTVTNALLCLFIQRWYDPDRWAVRVCPSRPEPLRGPPLRRNRPMRCLRFTRRLLQPLKCADIANRGRYGLWAFGAFLWIWWTTNVDCCGRSLLEERGQVNGMYPLFFFYFFFYFFFFCFFFMFCRRMALQMGLKPRPLHFS